MRIALLVAQIGITLFLVALTVEAIASWKQLTGFDTFILGFAAGTGTSLGIVYGILRKPWTRKKKPEINSGGCGCLHCDPQ